MRRTVVIVDDHPGFRASVWTLLDHEGFEVVGVAANGAQAIEEVGRLRPDVVLLDVQLPDIDGFAVADRLAADANGPAVVLISSRDAVTYGARLLAAPARGFIAKRNLSGEALSALLP